MNLITLTPSCHPPHLPRNSHLAAVAKSVGETQLLYLVYGALSQSTPMIA